MSPQHLLGIEPIDAFVRFVGKTEMERGVHICNHARHVFRDGVQEVLAIPQGHLCRFALGDVHHSGVAAQIFAVGVKYAG